MFIDLHDLMMFFEAEPVTGEADVPWPYAGVSFDYRSSTDHVWCRLAPGEGQLALVWRQGNFKRLEIVLEGYSEIKRENQSGVERLVAIPDDRGARPFVLQLRPHVFVALGAVGGPLI